MAWLRDTLEQGRRGTLPGMVRTGARFADAAAEFREHVDQAVALLEAEHSSSDAWFEVGERLGRSAWVVGSMTHCLHEWSEPDDAHPGHDEHNAPGDERLKPDVRVRARARRRGRRSAGLWREGRGG